MRVTKVRIKNFKSIGGKWVEFNLSDGLTLMTGKNGHGKTTIFYALNYGLFGKNADMRADSKTSIAASELINDINKKDMLVEVYLDSGITIRRGMKPDLFEIIDADGHNLADKSSKTIDQTFLEQNYLGGLTHDMFHKLTYISSKAISTPFLYMSPSQRKDFLEHILDIRLIHFVNEVIKQRSSEIKLDIKTTETDLSRINISVEKEKQNIENLKVKRDEQISSLEKMKQSKEEIISRSKDKISDFKKEINGNDYNISLLDLDIEQETVKISEHKRLVSEKSSKIIEKRSIETQINQIKTEMIRKQDQKKLHEKNLEGFQLCGSCPTVLKIVGEFDLVEYGTFMNDGKSEATELIKKLKVVEEEIAYLADLESELVVLERGLSELKLKYRELESNNLNLKASIKSEEGIISSIENDLDSIKPIDVNESYLEDLHQEQNDISSKYDGFVLSLEQVQRIKKRVGDKTLYEEIMRQYVPIFVAKVNELLSKFMEDDSFSFTISLSDSFEVSGMKNGRPTNIYKLSEGQKSSMHFATLFSFHYILELKNDMALDMLLVDEVLDIALDASRVDKVVQYLKKISETKPVILISHNPDIQQEYFDRVVSVGMKNGFSEYTIEGE